MVKEISSANWCATIEVYSTIHVYLQNIYIYSKNGIYREDSGIASLMIAMYFDEVELKYKPNKVNFYVKFCFDFVTHEDLY